MDDNLPTGADLTEGAKGIAVDVAKDIGGELKNLGKSIIGQIKGSDQTQQSPSQASDSQASDQKTQKPEEFSIFGEFKKMGQAAGSQMAGSNLTLNPDTQADRAADLAKKDQEFSEKEAERVRGRIDQIYKEYAQKKSREIKQKQEQEAQQEAQRKAKVQQLEKQKRQDFTNPAIAKTRAENKNYGAE